MSSVWAQSAVWRPPRKKMIAARTDAVEKKLNSVLALSHKVLGNGLVALLWASANRGELRSGFGR